MFLRGNSHHRIDAVRIATSAALMSVVSFSKEVLVLMVFGFILSLHQTVSH